MDKMYCTISHAELYREVTVFLHELGIPAHLNGYTYMRYALLRIIEDPTALRGIMKGLYQEITDTYDTTVANVEKAIRKTIEAAYLRNDPDILYAHFKNTIDRMKGKPTNKEFLALVAEVFRCKYYLP